MERHFYPIVLGATLLILVLGRFAEAKGCNKIPLTLKEVTEVRSQIGNLKASPGKLFFCDGDFTENALSEESTAEEILKKGFVVGTVVVAEKLTLGNLVIDKATEIIFPDIFAHGDHDYQITSGGTRKVGGLTLVASRALPIGVHAYEYVTTKGTKQPSWQLRKDGWMQVTGHLADAATVAGIPLLAGHTAAVSGPIAAFAGKDPKELRLVVGTVASESSIKGSKATIRFFPNDVVVFNEKPTEQGRVRVMTRPQSVFIQGKEVQGHKSFDYSEKTGWLLAFTPAEDFEMNGMKIAKWTNDYTIPVTLYPGNKLASAIPREDQTVQGVGVKGGWDPVYFWDNGKLLHAPLVEDEKFIRFKWDGKNISAYRVSLSFNAKGALRLVFAPQAKAEGEREEFSALFEVKDGVYTRIAKDSPIHKWYDWRGYNDELRDWLTKYP